MNDTMVTSLVSRRSAARFADDLRAGLGRDGQKELPAKYFYDAVGSALFEAICELPEYGVTRAGMRLASRYAEELVERLPGPTLVAELGPGSARKTRFLIAALARRQPVSYHPIDISGAALAQSERELQGMGQVSVFGYEAEYLDGARAVAQRRRAGECLMVLFLGSSIGNFDPTAAVGFLSDLRSVLEPGDFLLLSTDLVKAEAVLLAAYDDPTGVTAAFNKNLLARINREMGGNFDLRAFAHQARWNVAERRIEMHLVSRVDQMARIEGVPLDVRLRAGETIWTESSHKYTIEGVREMVGKAGFACQMQWVDEEWPYAQSLCAAV